MEYIHIIILALLIAVLLQTSYLTMQLFQKIGKAKSTDVLIDTSVLMDGRIIGIATAGFFPGTLVVPRSVVGELQLLADNGDSEKRERARRGLDVLRELQDMDGLTVQILQDNVRTPEGVDERLLALAKQRGAHLCTIDFNLAKVAVVEDITVLNINELARGLRMVYLPGDTLSLELTTKGSDSHQAVGHLSDGTMVVVEQAKQFVGSTVEIEIIRSLQTAAGKMMFARLAQKKGKAPELTKVTPKSRPIKKQRMSDSRPVAENKRPRNNSSPSRQSKKRTSKASEETFIDLVNKQ